MFKEYVEENKKRIDEEILNFFKKNLNEYMNLNEKLEELLKLLEDANLGGKRIRGLLVMLGYEIASLKKCDEIVKAGVCYELFQTGILIHDDIIDKSDLRRGKPTIHKKLSGDHLATSNAICLGDLSIFLSYKLLSSLNLDNKNLVRGINYFSKTLESTVIGELIDINLAYGKSISEKDVIDIAYYKTAWYTVIGPLTLGFILAGADEPLIRLVFEFGKNIGIAFQLRDDILGIYSDEKTLGKSVISDICEKKVTLLYSYTITNADEKTLSEFNSIYGKEYITKEEHEKIKKIYKEVGSLKHAEDTMNEYVERAISYIDKITNESKFKTLLTEFSYYLVKREK